MLPDEVDLSFFLSSAQTDASQLRSLFTLVFSGFFPNYPSTLSVSNTTRCSNTKIKMKSVIFAAAAAAGLASAHEARSPLDLGLNVGKLVNVDLCLGLDVKLPLGISIDSKGCPTSPPPSGCTNVWHPPHHVDMDGCDDNGNHGWHYVHPCDCENTVPPHTWATSTITETCLSTVISCAPEVTNCPGRTTILTTVQIPATTTVCPVAVTTSTLAVVTTKAAETTPCPTPTTPCPEELTTAPVVVVTSAPAVVAPPPAQQWTSAPAPAVVAPPPMGTGSSPVVGGGNGTTPVTAGATQNKVGAAVALGVVAAFFL